MAQRSQAVCSLGQGCCVCMHAHRTTCCIRSGMTHSLRAFHPDPVCHPQLGQLKPPGITGQMLWDPTDARDQRGHSYRIRTVLAAEITAVARLMSVEYSCIQSSSTSIGRHVGRQTAGQIINMHELMNASRRQSKHTRLHPGTFSNHEMSICQHMLVSAIPRSNTQRPLWACRSCFGAHPKTRPHL